MSKASDQAYQIIRARILSGSFAAGTQLKEEELAEICGVSRTPVRDALLRLEAEVLVQRSDRHRAYVAHWSDQDVEEVFALRAMLEGHAAARAALKATPDQIAELKSCHQKLDQLLTAKGGLNVDGFLEHNRTIHRLVLAAAGSDRLAELLSRLTEQAIVLRTARAYSKPDLLQSNAEHRELITAIEAHDTAWAEAVMSAHIRRAYHSFRQSRALELKSAAE